MGQAQAEINQLRDAFAAIFGAKEDEQILLGAKRFTEGAASLVRLNPVRKGRVVAGEKADRIAITVWEMRRTDLAWRSSLISVWLTK